MGGMRGRRSGTDDWLRAQPHGELRARPGWLHIEPPVVPQLLTPCRLHAALRLRRLHAWPRCRLLGADGATSNSSHVPPLSYARRGMATVIRRGAAQRLPATTVTAKRGGRGGALGWFEGGKGGDGASTGGDDGDGGAVVSVRGCLLLAVGTMTG